MIIHSVFEMGLLIMCVVCLVVEYSAWLILLNISTILPFTVIKICMIMMRRCLRLNTREYKRLSYGQNYVQMVVAIVFLILQWTVMGDMNFFSNDNDTREDVPAYYFMYAEILEYYLLFLLMIFVIQLSTIMLFFCLGCRFESRPADELGILSRAFDPFKFQEHTECTICLLDFY